MCYHMGMSRSSSNQAVQGGFRFVVLDQHEPVGARVLAWTNTPVVALRVADRLGGLRVLDAADFLARYDVAHDGRVTPRSDRNYYVISEVTL